MRSSVLFWYFRISLRATVPGLKRWGFFTPPVAGADLRAALVASCFLGAFPPVDFLAVCFVRAIWNTKTDSRWKKKNAMSGDCKSESVICCLCELECIYIRWRLRKRLSGKFLECCFGLRNFDSATEGPLMRVGINGCGVSSTEATDGDP